MSRTKKRKTSKIKRVKISAEKQLFIIIVLIVVLFILIISTRTCAQQNLAPIYVESKNLELPKIENPDFVTYNTEGRYTISYDTSFRQAAWVAYTLTHYDVSTKNAVRKNRFITDPEIKSKGWAYSTNADYTKSGYDKGHLLPSADRDNSQQENDATFLLSNISPQRPGLNRKLWNSLESMVREVALKYDTTYIVTGIIKGKTRQRIGHSGVGVPEKFFKTVLVKENGEYIAVAFVMPNSDTLSQSIWSYAISVDSLEKLTNYNFFYNLPDSLENSIEKRLPVNLLK